MATSRKFNSKAMTLSAVMRNSRLAHLMEEAINAPLGSTKRTRMRSVLRSLKKVHDGQGGPGNGFSLNVPSAPMSSTSNYTPANMSPASINRTSVSPYTGQAPVSSSSPFSLPSASTDDFITQGIGMQTARSTTPVILPPLPKKPVSPYPQTTAHATTQQPFGAPSGAQPQAPGGEQMLTDEQIAAMFSGTSAEGVSDSFINQWWGSLPKEDQNQFQGLYSAVNSNLGPEAFAFQMLTDKEALKKLFPNVPEGALPEGASLSRQVKDLSDRLKDEYNLEGLRNNVLRQIQTGVTLPGTLQSYVRGRDEYLNKIDTMMDTTKERMLDMDLANPVVNKRMNNYLNYLSVLRGRQNQRYADFVKTSIDENTAKTDQLKSFYEGQVAQFNDEFKMQGAILGEDYTRFEGMLKNMYTTLDELEDKELKREQAEANLLYTNAQIMDKIADAAGNEGEIDWITNAKTYFNILGIDESAREKTGTKTPVQDIAQMGALAEGTKDTTEDGVIYHLGTNVFKKEIRDVSDLNLVDDWYKQIKKYGQSVQSDHQRSQAVWLAETLYDSALSGIHNELRDPLALKDVREALDDLTGIDIKEVMKSGEKEGWINDHSGNIDRNFLGVIYDFYKDHLLAGIDRKDVFTSWPDPKNHTRLIEKKKLGNVSDEELSDQVLMNGLNDYYTNKVGELNVELFGQYR